MWSFLRKLVGKTDAAPTPEPIDPQRLKNVLASIDAGVEARDLPTLVCRKCGLKYVNTGTFLQGAQCPDCAEKSEGR